MNYNTMSTLVDKVNTTLEAQIHTVAKRGNSILERIAQKAGLNRCAKCDCLRTRHELGTGKCKDCECVNRRNSFRKNGRDVESLFDMEGRAE